MMTFLEFTFQSFWTFIGVIWIISAFFSGTAEVIRAFRDCKETDEVKEDVTA